MITESYTMKRARFICEKVRVNNKPKKIFSESNTVLDTATGPTVFINPHLYLNLIQNWVLYITGQAFSFLNACLRRHLLISLNLYFKFYSRHQAA